MTIAHAGHWMEGALYLVPVVVLVVVLALQGRGDKTAQEAEGDAPRES